MTPMHFIAGQSQHNWEYEVFLNGERLPDCVAADDSDGWADSRVMGSRGHERDVLGQLRTVRSTGHVQILHVNTESWPLTTAAQMEKRKEFFAELDAERSAHATR